MAILKLKDFILYGMFEIIQLGQTKNEILEKFIKPESIEELNGGFSILAYGTVELHFFNNKLILIWCDNLQYIDSYSQLKVDKWILNEPNKLTVSFVMDTLHYEKIDYNIKHNDKLKNSIIKIKKSNVTLWFEILDNDFYPYLEPSKYELVAIGLSANED